MAEKQDEMDANLISMAEVRMHSTSDDPWIVIHGKVYQIKKFLSEHPGGDLILIQSAGTDATEAFEDIMHSQKARDQLEKYFIGMLKQGEDKLFHLDEAKNQQKKKDMEKYSSREKRVRIAIFFALFMLIYFFWPRK